MSREKAERHIREIARTMNKKEHDIARVCIELWLTASKVNASQTFVQELTEHYVNGRDMVPTYYAFVLKLDQHAVNRGLPNYGAASKSANDAPRLAAILQEQNVPGSSGTRRLNPQSFEIALDDLELARSMEPAVRADSKAWAKDATPLAGMIEQKLSQLLPDVAPSFRKALATWKKTHDQHRHASLVTQVQALCTLATRATIE